MAEKLHCGCVFDASAGIILHACAQHSSERSTTMPPGYYIHSANGQTSLVELCDRDGNVIAEIMPKGSPTHRAAVVDVLGLIVEILNDVKELAPYGYRVEI